LAGTITETTMVAVGRMPALTLRAAQGLTAARGAAVAAKAIGIAGKVAGAAAGIIAAFFDALHAREEFKQANWGMFGLYAASAATGTVLAVGLAAGLISGGVAIVLLIILVALAVIIELFKDNKIQDWLERTLWGIEGDQFGSMEVEMKQLEVAIAG